MNQQPQQCRVQVTLIIDPDNFWAQVGSESLIALLKNYIEKLKAGGEKRCIKDCLNEKYLLVKSIVGGDWRRAELIRIARSSNAIDVFYSDFGTTELIKQRNDCYVLNAVVMSSPLAYKCSLAGIKPITSTWTPRATKRLEDLTLNKTLDAEILHNPSAMSNEMILNIYDSDGKSIQKIFLDEELGIEKVEVAVPIPPQMMSPDPPIHHHDNLSTDPHTHAVGNPNVVRIPSFDIDELSKAHGLTAENLAEKVMVQQQENARTNAVIQKDLLSAKMQEERKLYFGTDMPTDTEDAVLSPTSPPAITPAPAPDSQTLAVLDMISQKPMYLPEEWANKDNKTEETTKAAPAPPVTEELSVDIPPPADPRSTRKANLPPRLSQPAVQPSAPRFSAPRFSPNRDAPKQSTTTTHPTPTKNPSRATTQPKTSETSSAVDQLPLHLSVWLTQLLSDMAVTQTVNVHAIEQFLVTCRANHESAVSSILEAALVKGIEDPGFYSMALKIVCYIKEKAGFVASISQTLWNLQTKYIRTDRKDYKLKRRWASKFSESKDTIEWKAAYCQMLPALFTAAMDWPDSCADPIKVCLINTLQKWIAFNSQQASSEHTDAERQEAMYIDCFMRVCKNVSMSLRRAVHSEWVNIVDAVAAKITSHKTAKIVRRELLKFLVAESTRAIETEEKPTPPKSCDVGCGTEQLVVLCDAGVQTVPSTSGRVMGERPGSASLHTPDLSPTVSHDKPPLKLITPQEFHTSRTPNPQTSERYSPNPQFVTPIIDKTLYVRQSHGYNPLATQNGAAYTTASVNAQVNAQLNPPSQNQPGMMDMNALLNNPQAAQAMANDPRVIANLQHVVGLLAAASRIPQMGVPSQPMMSVNAQGQPIGPRGQPMYPRGQQIGAIGQPMGPIARPIGAIQGLTQPIASTIAHGNHANFPHQIPTANMAQQQTASLSNVPQQYGVMTDHTQGNINPPKSTSVNHNQTLFHQSNILGDEDIAGTAPLNTYGQQAMATSQRNIQALRNVSSNNISSGSTKAPGTYRSQHGGSQENISQYIHPPDSSNLPNLKHLAFSSPNVSGDANLPNLHQFGSLLSSGESAAFCVPPQNVHQATEQHQTTEQLAKEFTPTPPFVSPVANRQHTGQHISSPTTRPVRYPPVKSQDIHAETISQFPSTNTTPTKQQIPMNIPISTDYRNTDTSPQKLGNYNVPVATTTNQLSSMSNNTTPAKSNSTMNIPVASNELGMYRMNHNASNQPGTPSASHYRDPTYNYSPPNADENWSGSDDIDNDDNIEGIILNNDDEAINVGNYLLSQDGEVRAFHENSPDPVSLSIKPLPIGQNKQNLHSSDTNSRENLTTTPTTSSQHKEETENKGATKEATKVDTTKTFATYEDYREEMANLILQDYRTDPDFIRNEIEQLKSDDRVILPPPTSEDDDEKPGKTETETAPPTTTSGTTVQLMMPSYQGILKQLESQTRAKSASTGHMNSITSESSLSGDADSRMSHIREKTYNSDSDVIKNKTSTLPVTDRTQSDDNNKPRSSPLKLDAFLSNLLTENGGTSKRVVNNDNSQTSDDVDESMASKNQLETSAINHKIEEAVTEIKHAEYALKSKKDDNEFAPVRSKKRKDRSARWKDVIQDWIAPNIANQPEMPTVPDTTEPLSDEENNRPAENQPKPEYHVPEYNLRERSPSPPPFVLGPRRCAICGDLNHTTTDCDKRSNFFI